MPGDKTQQRCKHPFVWPNGDCVDCGVLATTMPGHTEPHHISVPRKFEPLIRSHVELVKALEAAKSELQRLMDVVSGDDGDSISDTLTEIEPALTAAGRTP